MAAVGAIGAIDWAMLALLLVSVVLGLWRGLLLEVAMLVGWVVAYFTAQWLAADLAPHLPVGAPGSGANRGAAFALVFVLALIVWGLAAKAVRMLVHATPLSVVDRVGGAAFGLLRGAVVLLAVATLVGFTPAAQSPLWQSSTGARWTKATVSVLKPLLPPDLRQWLPE
ncbi:MAG: CvpA family protein [Rubrivivax sp.]|nr:CvpA family protein [Rubrivivax sp.]